jgi:two-component system cell cycle sensor histidine kinase/response regulator CckA
VAANGEAALRWVEAEGVRPDLLVTDASMPRMGGVSLAAEMRRRWPELPVVIMSGYAEDLTMPGLESSGQVFVQKPFTSSRLLEIVNTALSPG